MPGNNPADGSLATFGSGCFWCVAEKSMAEAAKGFSRRIVTQLEPLEAFYAAEDYHQDYFEKNPNAAYCAFVITPKLNRLGLLD